MEKERAEEKPKHNMNRPSSQWFHTAGFKLHMYHDEPGVFRDFNENVIPDALAKSAMEPSEFKRWTRAKASKVVKDEMNASIAAADAAEEREVVEEFGEHRLVALSTGLYVIERLDGTPLTPKPISKAIADATFAQLRKMEAEEETAEPLLFGKKAG